MYFHSSTQLLLHRYSPTLANSNVPESRPQDGTEYTYGQLFMYTNGSAVKIQTPTQWNLIGRNMTAPPPVALPSSSSPTFILLSFHCRKEKFGTHFKKFHYLIFFTFFKNCLNVKLRKPESVCIFFASFDNIFTTYHTRL